MTGPADLSALGDLLAAPPQHHGMVPGGTIGSALVRALHDAGHEVDLVTLAPGVDAPYRRSGEQLTVHVGRYRPRHRARDAFAAERRSVASALRSLTVDVVHAQWSYEFALGALASGLPTLVTVHDWAPAVLRHHPHPYRVVRLGMNAVVFARAPYLTTPSPVMADRIRPWTRGDVTVVPNGLDDRVFAAPDAVDRRPHPALATRLLAVNHGAGRLKNVRTLLTALAAVRRTVPGAELRLVGRDHGPDGPVHRWARARGLDTGVTFVGAVPAGDVLREMDAADVFVHPSLEESFGMVVLEAMARGLPVVGGIGSGAVPWLLGDGEAGVLTDVRSSDRMSADLTQLLLEPDARRLAGRSGYARASAHFRSSVVVDQLLARYRLVASSG